MRTIIESEHYKVMTGYTLDNNTLSKLKAYVDTVELRWWPVMEEMFGMKARIRHYQVILCETTGYGLGGKISLDLEDLKRRQLNNRYSKNLAGALCHETCHGPFEPLIHLPGGEKNPINEPFPIILQIATLEGLVDEHAQLGEESEAMELIEIAKGYREDKEGELCLGSKDKQLLLTLVEVLDDYGIAPFQSFFKELEAHDEPIVCNDSERRYSDYCFYMSKHASVNLSPIFRKNGLEISQDVETKIKDRLKSD